MSGNKRPATDDAVTGQECVHLGGNTILNPPRQILKLDLGPMSRSRCSNQNFQIDLRQKYQTSWRALLARKRWVKSKKRREPKFKIGALMLAGRHRLKTNKFLEGGGPREKPTIKEHGGGREKKGGPQ